MAWDFNGSPVGGVVTLERDLRDLNLTNHLDLPSLLPFAAKGGIKHMGTRDLYVMANRADVPFLLPNIQGGTIVNLEDDKYSFDIPNYTEIDTTIVSVDQEPGTQIKANVPFKFTVSNGRLGAYGSILAVDLQQPYNFEVIEAQKKGTDGSHVQYTAIYRGNIKGENVLPGDVLIPGKSMYKLGATRSKEFGQNYDGWQVTAPANKTYVGRISDYQLQTHYHMTYQACNFAEGKRVENKQWVLENLQKAVQFVTIKDKVDPSIKYMNQWMDKDGDKSKIGFSTLVTVYDNISIGILEREIQNMMVWAAGGWTGSDGLDKQYIHPGVWHQYAYSGYNHVFPLNAFSKEMLMAAILGYETNRVAPPSLGDFRTYNIRTGAGGEKLLQRIFADEFKAIVQGMVMADTIGQFSGSYKSGLEVNTPWFKSIIVDGKYRITYTVDPSLNPSKANDVTNPLIGGYRLSSYSMIIEDANWSRDNIKIFRNSLLNGGGMHMFVKNGTMAHPLTTVAGGPLPFHQAADLSSGFATYFHANPDTAVVWDPTRMLRMVPINPLTGRPSL